MNCQICGEPGHESNENQAYLCISYLRAQRDEMKFALKELMRFSTLEGVEREVQMEPVVQLVAKALKATE